MLKQMTNKKQNNQQQILNQKKASKVEFFELHTSWMLKKKNDLKESSVREASS